MRGEINPTDRSIYDELATLYATKGNLEAAVIVLDQKLLLFGVQPHHADLPAQRLRPLARWGLRRLSRAAPD